MSDRQQPPLPEPIGLDPRALPWARALTRAIQDGGNFQARVLRRLDNVSSDQDGTSAAVRDHGESIKDQGEILDGLDGTLNPVYPQFPPTQPILTTSMGQVGVDWDGMLLDGGGNEVPPTTGFRHVRAEWSDTSDDGPWQRVAEPLNSNGIIAFPAPVGSTVFVRLVAVSYGQVEDSEPSAVASIVVTGVQAPDIDSAITDAIDQAIANSDEALSQAGTALTAANGKNKIIFSTAVASGTNYAEGDIWFQKSGALIIAQWEFTNGAWESRTLDNAVIGNLNAGKINAGTLNAARIGADTISVNKLLVASLENLLQAPGFETTSTEAWTLSNGATNGTTNPRSGSRALSIPSGTAAVVAKQTNGFAVEEGEQYRIGGWVRLASGTSALNGVTMRVEYGATNATATTASADLALTPNGTGTAYVQISGTWTAPAGAKFARIAIVRRDTNAGKTYYIDDTFCYKMASSELIVDGAIITRTLAAGAVTGEKVSAETLEGNHLVVGTIEVDRLSPNVGSSLNLEGNGVIVTIGGQVDAQAEALSSQQNQIDGVQSNLDAVGATAANAQTLANGAQQAADNAQAVATDASNAIAQLGQTYRFTSTGAFVGAPDSPYEFVIQNTGAQIRYNGTPVSEWNGDQMRVKNFVGESVILANHQIEAYGTGTVVRAI